MNEMLQKRIAEKAYLHFLQRGGVHGFDLDDWFRAEREVIEDEMKRRSHRKSTRRASSKETSTKKTAAKASTVKRGSRARKKSAK